MELTPEKLLSHYQERDEIENEIKAFARSFAYDCDQVLGKEYLIDGWEIYAEVVNVYFAYSYQGGEHRKTVKFPIAALTDAEVREEAVNEYRAKRQAERDEEEQRRRRRDEAEFERLKDRLGIIGITPRTAGEI